MTYEELYKEIMNEAMSTFWIAMIISLSVNIFIAVICLNIAGEKGRSTVGWFFGGLFFGLICVVMVYSLPDLKGQNKPTHEYVPQPTYVYKPIPKPVQPFTANKSADTNVNIQSQQENASQLNAEDISQMITQNYQKTCQVFAPNFGMIKRINVQNGAKVNDKEVICVLGNEDLTKGITAKSSGIVSLNVVVGQFVQQGDVIAEIIC